MWSVLTLQQFSNLIWSGGISQPLQDISKATFRDLQYRSLALCLLRISHPTKWNNNWNELENLQGSIVSISRKFGRNINEYNMYDLDISIWWVWETVRGNFVFLNIFSPSESMGTCFWLSTVELVIKVKGNYGGGEGYDIGAFGILCCILFITYQFCNWIPMVAPKPVWKCLDYLVMSKHIRTITDLSINPLASQARSNRVVFIQLAVGCKWRKSLGWQQHHSFVTHKKIN